MYIIFNTIHLTICLDSLFISSFLLCALITEPHSQAS